MSPPSTAGRPRGLLRISLPTAFGRLHVAPRLKTFLDAESGAELLVDLERRLRGHRRRHLRRGGAHRHPPRLGLVARRLAPNRRVLCAAPAYCEKYGKPRDLKDLAPHGCSPPAPQIVWRLEGPEGPVTYKPQSSLQTNSSEVVREAVISGLGIGFRSTWDIGNELKLGILKRVLPEYGGARRREHLCVYLGPAAGAAESAGIRRLLRRPCSAATSPTGIAKSLSARGLASPERLRANARCASKFQLLSPKEQAPHFHGVATASRPALTFSRVC